MVSEPLVPRAQGLYRFSAQIFSCQEDALGMESTLLHHVSDSKQHLKLLSDKPAGGLGSHKPTPAAGLDLSSYTPPRGLRSYVQSWCAVNNISRAVLPDANMLEGITHPDQCNSSCHSEAVCRTFWEPPNTGRVTDCGSGSEIKCNTTSLCRCNNSFCGNGLTCSDINECVHGTHNCDRQLAKCNNTHGSFACECIQGYQGDGITCTDISECSDPSLNDCDFSATCREAPGSFQCVCPQRFAGLGITTSPCTNGFITIERMWSDFNSMSINFRIAWNQLEYPDLGDMIGIFKGSRQVLWFYTSVNLTCPGYGQAQCHQPGIENRYSINPVSID
jgi:hypothetical protein